MRHRFGPLSTSLIALAFAAGGVTAAHAQFQAAPNAPATGSFGQPLPPPPPPAAATIAPGEAAPAPAQAAPQVARPRRPAAPPRYAALPRDPRPTFTVQSIEATEQAVARYRRIVAEGGWGRVTAGDPARLRERLIIEGDLEANASPAEVTAGVRRFQARHGLVETGTLSGPTLTAMNVPAQQRLQQLEASLGRMRASTFGFGERYVIVNIPAAAVETVEGGQVRRRYIAVVGKADRASPPVETRITNINFNPTWTVPASIIRKDIIPKMQRDPGYLTRAKIRILDGRGGEINPRSVDWSSERAVNYTLRQDPGAGNSLGQVRIDMPNNLAVYMHDTPSKSLFARDDRFHSSGCVRVADVRDLVTWLLAGSNGNWSRADTDEAIAEGERRDVRLAKPVPVAWTYFTGYGMPDGTAHFRPDIYKLDAQGGGQPIAMRSQPRPLPQPEPVEIPPPEPVQSRGFWDLFRPAW